jgi:type IV pilus assembly protein PilW
MNFLRFAASRQRGASLIELMVAMVIGLVILLAVSEVFVNNNRIRGEVERTGRQIENGVFALQMLEDELSNAGFWGETTVAGGGTVPPVCPAFADLDDAMGYPVQPGDGTCEAGIKANTDSLAIRRASTCALDTPNCDAVNDALPYVQVQACGSSVGDIQLALGDAGLEYRTRDSNADGSCTDEFFAPIYRYLSRLYYVTNNDELARMNLEAAGYVSSGPLVDGIEQLHFSYGIDGDGDGMVDSYVDDPAAELENVIAVRIWLVARNLQPTQGYNDDRTYQLGDFAYIPAANLDHKRQVYSTVVTLRNVAGPREVQ